MTRRVYKKLCATGFILFLFLAPARTAGAEHRRLPADTMAALTVKVLNYDRSLEQRAGDEVTLGIVSISDEGEAESHLEDWFSSFKQMSDKYKIRELPFKVEKFYIRPKDRLSAQEYIDLLKGKKINVLILDVHDRSTGRDMCAAAKVLKINTISDNLDNISFTDGLTFGIVLQNERPKLFINIENAKNEGSDYSSKLFPLCELK